VAFFPLDVTLDVPNMKDLTPKKIKVELDNVHSTSAPAFAIVYN